MIKERRKHPRLRIPLEAEYLVAGAEEWRQGTVWTLGAGGAALLCDQQLELGAVLDGLHFVVEAEGDLPETRIDVSAKVVSIDRKDDFGRATNFMLGLQFTGLGEQEFELLRQFVFRRLTGTRPASGDGDDDVGKKKRAGAAPIEIRFKLFEEFVEEVSENLSPSGMFIRSKNPLPPGSRFPFQFHLGDDFSLFQGAAEVVWTRRRSEGPERPPGMGVRFLELGLASQKMVQRLVGRRAADGAAEAGEVADDGRFEDESTAAVEVSGEAEPFALDQDPPAAGDPQPDPETQPSAARAGDQAMLEKRLRRRLARFEKRLGEMESGRDEAVRQAERLAGENAALREENQALESSYADVEEARRRAETEASELLREVETLQPNADLEQKLLQTRDQLERLQADWQSQEAKLRAQLEQKSIDEERLNERLSDAVAVETELRAQLKRKSADEEELNELVSEAADTEAELRAQLEHKSVDQEKLNERLSEASCVAAELQGQLEQKSAVEEELNELVSEAACVEAELRSQLGQKRADEEELNELLAQAADTEADLHAQLERQRTEETRLESRLSEAVDTEAELRQQLTDSHAAGDELEQRLKQSAEVEAVLREQMRELHASRDDVETKLAHATVKLDRMSAAAGETDSVPRTAESEPQMLVTNLAAAPEETQIPTMDEAEGAVATAEDEAEGVMAAAQDEAESVMVTALESDEPVAEARNEPRQSEPGGVMRRMASWFGFSRPPAPQGESGTLESATVPADEMEFGSESMSEETVEEEFATEPTVQVELESATEPAVLAEPEAEPLVLEEAETEPTASNEPDGNETDGSVAIEETVRAWAAAWSERRVEDYLSFYSRAFEPGQAGGDGASGGSSRAWLPPLAGMELRLGPICQVEVAPGRYAVQFEQSVESDSYTRRTGRTLELVRESDAWKIAAESFQELPN
jgi:uncharacterized protein (TIGR02266 family)